MILVVLVVYIAIRVLHEGYVGDSNVLVEARTSIDVVYSRCN